MKLSKSKLALAKVINENGGWVDGADSCSYNKYIRQCVFYLNGFRAGGFDANPFHNWHQTILSREEYYQAYPKADADGWLEWSGGECPVGDGDRVDYKLLSGSVVTIGEVAGDLKWHHEFSTANIIAYRLHKQEVKHEFCESVMRSIPELESKPTIEQLAQDYRNKLDYANRKQDEADKANMESDAALSQLEDAIAEIGFAITPLAATEQEPEPVIAVQVGDEVECVESNIKRDKYNGMVGRLRTIDESDTSTPYLVDFGGEERIWCHEVKFIRRP